MSSFVKCSNYIGDTFRMMKEEKIDRVLLAGHLGKPIKVAGGVMNTHSEVWRQKNGDPGRLRSKGGARAGSGRLAPWHEYDR